MPILRDITPMLKHNFNMGDFSCLTEEENRQFSIAVVSLHYTHIVFTSLVSDNRLIIHVEEPENGSISKIIEKLVNEQFDIEVHNLNRYGKAIQTKVFKHCRLVGYTYELDYSTYYSASHEPCRYPLEFSVAYAETK